MEKNELYTSTYYRAASPKDDCGLESPRDTLAELVDMISYAEARAQVQGFPPQEWLVVQVRVNTIRKDGRFHYRNTTEEAIGIYGKDGKLRHLDGTEWGRIG